MTALRAFFIPLAATFTFIASLPTQAHNKIHTDRPDGHAPIGVMGDHVHKAGEWMLSYRFMNMRMKDNYVDTDKVSTSDVHSNFMVSPLNMTMNMHMLGGMYAPTDNLTLMVMLPFLDNKMDLQMRSGRVFQTDSSGLGDVKVSSLLRIYDNNKQQVILGLGLGLPTGAIDERGDTPMMQNVKLPYPMQLGSGTYDVMPKITYIGQTASFSWGAQLGGTLRGVFGDSLNDEGYRLGDVTQASTWVSRKLNNTVSLSARLEGKKWSNIHGRDAQLNPMMVPTARTDLRGGKRLDAALGANLYFPSMLGDNARLAIEYAKPVYQNLNGPQLGVDGVLTLGAQVAF